MKKWRMISFLLLLTFLCVSFNAYAQKLTLEACVEQALEKNPGLIQAKLSKKIAERDVVVERSSFLPSVNSSVAYTHSVIGPSSDFRIDPQTGILVPLQPNEVASWSSNANINVNMNLINGSNIFGYKQALSQKNSAQHSFEDSKQTIIYQVKERYYNLLKAEKLLEVAEDNIKLSEESLKRAEVLFEVGKVPKSDVLQARYEFENYRLSEIEARNSLKIAKASLNHILGRDTDLDIQIVDNLDVVEVEVEYQDAMENATSSHPLIFKCTYDVAAAKDQVGLATSAYLPSVSGYYGYSWRHKDFNEITNAFDTDYSWYMGAQLSIPIFQGFSRSANLSKAKLYHKSQKELLIQTIRDIEFEVQNAFFEVQQAKKKIAVTQNAEEVANENLRLNQEKYNLGAGTMLDLINAQVSYTEAKSNQIQSLYDYKYAIARLQKAMGQLVK